MQTVLTSNIVEKQLPEFVRSQHPQFVTFLKKYYEWLEQNNNVNYEINELKNSIDIDDANEDYLNILKRDLAPYFPENIVSDKRLFLKLISSFYKSSGTESSIKFLFRALYNENIDVYYPKEDILKTSDGKWVLPLALRVDTADTNIFNIEKTKITGQTSKATAIVEKVTRSVDRQLGISYIELYISNINRLFETGEIVSATYNNGTTNVTVNARLVGALSEIKIDPLNRGLYYNGYDPVNNYDGDPVTIVGGLNPTSNNPIGAIATVGETTKGGVTDVIVVNGGFGFRNESEVSSVYNGNVCVLDFKGGFETVPIGTEAKAVVSLIDDNTLRLVNIGITNIETLNASCANINVISSNTVVNVSDYTSFNVYPISYVVIDGSGGGYKNKPSLQAYSFYNEDVADVVVITSANIVKDTNIIVDETQDLIVSFEIGDIARIYKRNPNFEDILTVTNVTSNTISFANTFTNDIQTVSVSKILRNDLYNLGSLGRLSINNGGTGYAVGETINFIGGSGYGANAYVSEIHAGNNGIKTVTMNAHSSNAYALGGEGYMKNSLPTITVNTTSGANANLSVLEVLGDGESFDLTTSRIGAISSIRVRSYGYDYVEAPQVSLRNMDLTVANVTEGQIFISNTKIYQGTSNSNTTFTAFVDSYNSNTEKLRIFNYKGTLDQTKKIYSDDNVVDANVVLGTIVVYGDGRAKATAKFENGLIRYPGIYLNSDGHLSSDKYLQGSKKYHNFSYVIKSKTDYATFKKPINDIAHPIGTKILVTRVFDNKENANVNTVNEIVTIKNFTDTFNISYGANSSVSTNVSANLINQINVGDTLIFTNVYRSVANTVNVVSGSNTIFGSNCNFINDIIDGDIIYLSTGNTETVVSVANSSYLTTQNNINITANNVSINVFFNDLKTVTFVNANTVLVDSNFVSNSTFTVAKILKVK